MLFAMLAWSDASPNKKIKVKQEIRPGTRYVTTSMDCYQTEKVNAAPTKITYASRQRVLFKEETSKPDAEGFTTVTMTPLHVQSHLAQPERTEYELNYDSESTPADSPLTKIFQPMLKSRYVITRDSTGTFRSMLIKGNPWSKMIRACPESTLWIGRYAARVFGIRTMTEIFMLSNTHLPKHAVKQGDTWNLARTSCLPDICYGTPFKARVKVSSITKDQVVFTLIDASGWGAEMAKVRADGRTAGKVVFNRNSNTVTETCLDAISGNNKTWPKTGRVERSRTHVQIRVTVSDKLTKLKPLPPPPTPAEETPAKAPTTKPATPATPKTEKKTAVTAP
jgi:hypothetical protein